MSLIQQLRRLGIGSNKPKPSTENYRSAVLDMKIPSRAAAKKEISTKTWNLVIKIYYRGTLSSWELRNTKPEQYAKMDRNGTNITRLGSQPTHQAGTRTNIFRQWHGGSKNSSKLYHPTNVLVRRWSVRIHISKSQPKAQYSWRSRNHTRWPVMTKRSSPDEDFDRDRPLPHEPIQAVRPATVHNILRGQRNKSLYLHKDKGGHCNCPSDSNISPKWLQPYRDAR